MTRRKQTAGNVVQARIDRAFAEVDDLLAVLGLAEPTTAAELWNSVKGRIRYAARREIARLDGWYMIAPNPADSTAAWTDRPRYERTLAEARKARTEIAQGMGLPTSAIVIEKMEPTA